VAANARSNNKKARNRERIRLEQAADDPEAEVDLSDINRLFAERNRGPHMYELDFEPIEDEPPLVKVNGESPHWAWRHKYTDKVINRYPTGTYRGWDTGKLGNYLRSITEKNNRVAFYRAQHIVKLNERLKKKGVPAKVIVNRLDDIKKWVRYFFFRNHLLKVH
jgi:hypothetical protein